MSERFDPYYQWLGIRDPLRPPNHYRLLGLELYESDPSVIATAADRQMVFLRTLQHGPHAADSQRLLNEVAQARVCLLDPARRQAYDHRLSQSAAPAPPVTPRQGPPEPPRELPAGTEARPAAGPVSPVAGPVTLDRPPVANVGPPPHLDAGFSADANRVVPVKSELNVGALAGGAAERPRIVLSEPSPVVPLRPPGRGSREAAPRLQIALFVGVSVVFILAVVARQAYVSWARSTRIAQSSVATNPSTEPPATTASASQAEATQRASTSDRPHTTVADSAAVPKAAGESPATEVGASDDAAPNEAAVASAEPASRSASESNEAPGGINSASSVTPSRSGRPGGLATLNAWDESVTALTPQPAQFPTGTPAGELLNLLANRQVVAANELFKQWRKSPPAGMTDDQQADLLLVFDGIDAFWRLAEEAVGTLRPGNSLKFRQWSVKVVSVSPSQIELETATGQRRKFDLHPSKIHRDLAIGLVSHALSDSPAAALRCTGLFLAVDHQGDVELAKEYRQQAESRGLDMTFLDATLAKFVPSML